MTDYAALREAAEDLKSRKTQATVDAYIAAASPDVVLGLLDRIDLLEAERAKDLNGFIRLQQQLRIREGRIAELEQGLGDGVDGIFALREQNAALREMLAKYTEYLGGEYCPECSYHKTKGHESACALAALLETSA